NVTIAIPKDNFDEPGLLFAFLPTQHQTGLPFHINADFFPSTDRKRVILGDDYQGRWNKAAIEAAAEALSEHLTELTTLLGHALFWELIDDIKDVHKKSVARGNDAVFGCFWEKVKDELPKAGVIFTTTGVWVHPDESFLLRDGEEMEVVSILEELGLNIAHESLRTHHNLLREIGVPYLNALSLARAILKAGINEAVPSREAEGWLQSSENRELLGREVNRLLARASKDEKPIVVRQFVKCAIALTANGWLVPPQDVFRTSEQIIRCFEQLGLSGRFLSDDNPEIIKSLAEELTPRSALDLLDEAPAETLVACWQQDHKTIVDIIVWFSESGLSDDDKKRLRDLPLWPSNNKLHSLSELVVPGDFTDPLHLSKILDLSSLPVGRDFLFDIGARVLNLTTYASEQVPQAFASGDIASDVRRNLFELLTKNYSEISNSAEVRGAL
ncbi:MAG: hypothetical protein M3362_21990, partial [Acidobacteriota bacterium]|nr:hypothetical protein [Acidobacteriota bacterium]